MTLAAGASEGAAASDEAASVTAEAAQPPSTTASQPGAVELTAAELDAATESFAEARVIGKGGFGSVYVADAIPSLTLLAPRLAADGRDGLGATEAAPDEDSHPRLAVKRAESTTHLELQDVRNEVCESLLY
eukprot:948903-Prymnesium_polylepis.1